MRRVIVSNVMSLDGFVSGPNGELDWFVYAGFVKGTEFGEYARALISSVDGILLGRLTYEEFSSYWLNTQSGKEVSAHCAGVDVQRLTFRWNRLAVDRRRPFFRKDKRRMRRDSNRLDSGHSSNLIDHLLKEESILRAVLRFRGRTIHAH